jgi:type I restriction enzyme S subunit
MSNANGLPRGWAAACLGQLGVFINGDRGKNYPSKGAFAPSGVPFINAGHLENGQVDLSKMNYIDEDRFKMLGSGKVQPNDVLYCLRGSLGKAAIVAGLDRGAVASSLVIIRPRNNSTPKYLYYFLVGPLGKREISKYDNGSAQPNLSARNVQTYSVPVAPLNEQRRIVAKIEELFSDLDAGVAALEHAKAKLKCYRAAVLKAAVEGKLTAEWRSQHPPKETGSQLLERILAERRCKWEEEQTAAYEKAGKKPPTNWKDKYKEPVGPNESSLPELPEGWCWASVAQVAEVQGGIQKQPKRRPAQNAYPYLRVANVYRNRLDLSEVHEIELFGDELERLRLRAGDLLIVEGNGSITEIGRSALWQGRIENCVHQNHIIRVRFLAGHPGYLNAFWNSPTGNARVMESAASTSGLYTLSVAKVSSLPVPIAPVSEQEQIIAEVDRRLSIIEEAESQVTANLKRSARLRQSILKRAFEGKLVPQDPLDEPAGVLLERIKATRENGNPKTPKPARKTK